MLDPDGLLATTVASAADVPDGRAAPGDPAGPVGQTEPDAGHTDTEPDGLSERASPPDRVVAAGLSGPARLLGSGGLADAARPAGPGVLADSVALVSAADSADPPVPSVGWPSCPGRLLCAPICTTSSSPASVSNPERSRPAHQMKKQAQNNGSPYSAGATWRIGPASGRISLNSRRNRTEHGTSAMPPRPRITRRKSAGNGNQAAVGEVGPRPFGIAVRQFDAAEALR